MNRVGNYLVEHLDEDDSPRPECDISVDYYDVRNEEDPPPNKANLDPLEESLEGAITTLIKEMLHDAENHGL